jgi:uncharacterized protein
VPPRVPHRARRFLAGGPHSAKFGGERASGSNRALFAAARCSDAARRALTAYVRGASIGARRLMPPRRAKEANERTRCLVGGGERQDRLLAAWLRSSIAYIAEAMRFRRPLTDREDVSAENTLGVMYEIGHRVPQDDAQAAIWYRKAADQGDPFAQVNLGRMYANGLGVAQDYAQAAIWYRHAADQGNAVAQFSLGDMCDGGHGVPQDDGEALAWYRKAADQGHASAQYNLGVMYLQGQGVPQDYAKAVVWLSKAADQQHAKAQFALGLMYQHGQEGVPQNSAQAYVWLALSASHAVEDQIREQAIKTRDEVADKMTPAQIAEAQKMAREWKPTKSRD